MAILLEEEKVVKIAKFDFLIKMKLLLEMALREVAHTSLHCRVSKVSKWHWRPQSF
jgi:hypothetical protein